MKPSFSEIYSSIRNRVQKYLPESEDLNHHSPLINGICYAIAEEMYEQQKRLWGIFQRNSLELGIYEDHGNGD